MGLGIKLAACSCQPAAVILGSAMVGTDALCNPGSNGIGSHVPIHQPSQQGLYKKFCDKVGSHRMPGQTHNGLFPGFSQNGWFSGLNGNAVNVEAGLRIQ